MDRIARASWNFCPKNETEQAANGNRSTKCLCLNECNQSTHKQHGLNTNYWTRHILKGVGTKMSKQLSKCYTCSFLIGWMNKQYKNRVVSAKEGTSNSLLFSEYEWVTCINVGCDTSKWGTKRNRRCTLLIPQLHNLIQLQCNAEAHIGIANCK